MKNDMKLVVALAFFGFGSMLSMEEWGKDEPVSEETFLNDLEENESKSNIEAESDLDEKSIEQQNETSSLEITGIFPNELWLVILTNLFFDPKFITESSDIYEAVKKIERLYGVLSMTCVLFYKINEELKEESMKFYRTGLKDHFLEYRDRNTNKDEEYVKGLYPKNGEWNLKRLREGILSEGAEELIEVMLKSNNAGILSLILGEVEKMSELDKKVAEFMFTNNDVGIVAYILEYIKEEPINICLLLIFFGADMDRRRGIKERVHFALRNAVKRFPKLVPMLLAKGFRLDLALETAATIDGDNPDMVKFLISRGAVLSNSAHLFLSSMCSQGNLEILKILLAQKPDYIKDSYNKDDAICSIADIHEFSAKHQTILQILLDEGANINALVKHGYWVNKIETSVTPLMVACNKCFVKKIVRILLAHGADVNIQNPFKLTALVMAIKRFEKSKDIWREDLRNEVRKKSKKIIKLLLNANADVNVRDYNNETPLIHALDTDAEIVKILLLKGADVNATNKNGKNVLQLAEEKGDKEIIDALKHHVNRNSLCSIS